MYLKIISSQQNSRKNVHKNLIKFTLKKLHENKWKMQIPHNLRINVIKRQVKDV